MTTITLNCDRPALETIRDGKVARWEYDVVELQLLFEELSRSHPSDGPPTAGFLAAAAEALESQGLDDCTPELALRVHSVVKVQFRRLAADLARQLA